MHNQNVTVLIICRDMSGALDLHFLETFQVGNLIGALNLLVNWLNTGFCNFHTLPLGVKKEMSAEMVQCMEEKAKECRFTPSDAVIPTCMVFRFQNDCLVIRLHARKWHHCSRDIFLHCNKVMHVCHMSYYFIG